MQREWDWNPANFSLKKKDDIYYLRVRGSGHGVGFSQFGGNEMAKTEAVRRRS